MISPNFLALMNVQMMVLFPKRHSYIGTYVPIQQIKHAVSPCATGCRSLIKGARIFKKYSRIC